MTASAASESVPTPADLARGAETGETAPRLRSAWVVAGDRIPFAKSGGAYAQASVQDMFTAVLDGLVARTGLAGQRLGAVAGGAVLKQPKAFNMVRESVPVSYTHLTLPTKA